MNVNNYSNNRFTQLLQKFLKTRLRVDGLLNDLIIFISVSWTTKASRIDRSILYNAIYKQTDTIKIFKFCILVQRAVVQGFVPDCQELVEMLLAKIDNAVGSDLGNQATQFMKEKIVVPYLIYLQKRVGSDKIITDVNQKIKQLQKKNKIEENNSFYSNKNTTKKQKKVNKIIKPTEKGPTQQIISKSQLTKNESLQKKLQPHLHKCFYLINLINKCVYLCPAMLMMIRYFGGYFGCILDFNIAMGIDVQMMYSKLSEEITEVDVFLEDLSEIKLCKNQYKTSQIIAQLQKIQVMMKQVQIMNQGVQLLYYNCYHHKNLRIYAPKIIRTQRYNNLIDQKIKQLKRQQKWKQISEYVCTFAPSLNQKRTNRNMKSLMINSTLLCISQKNKQIVKGSAKNINKTQIIHLGDPYERKSKRANQELTIDPQTQIQNLQVSFAQEKMQKQFDRSNASTRMKSSSNESRFQQYRAKQLEQQVQFDFVQSQAEEQDEQKQYTLSKQDKQKRNYNIQLLLEMSQVFEKMVKLQQTSS